MPQPSSTISDPRVPILARRATAMFACGIALSAFLAILSTHAWALVAYHLVTDGARVMLWLLAAAGWGALIFRAWPALVAGVRTRLLRLVCAAALGLGVISLAVLGLGLIGALGFFASWFIVIGGAILAVWLHWPGIRAVNGESIARLFSARAGLSWAWIAIMPMLAVVMVASDAPPGVLWGDEPKGYDVVEYHLQAPREWYEAGRITALPHNVFSYMPMNVEMHFLLAMHLRGGPWNGMYLAQLMHALMTLLAVVAAYAIAREATGSNAAGTIAGLAMSCAPWLMLLAPVAYNDGGLLLFGTLAIGLAWLEFRCGFPSAEGEGGRDGRYHIGASILAGAMAGFACGVKLTAVPMLLLAIPLAVFCSGGRDGRRYRNAITFLIAGLVTFSPWLVRNIAWTRNPVFPEATSILGRAHFSEAQAERWRRAHSPPPELRPVRARLREAMQQIVLDWRYGYVLFPLALAAAALRIRERDARFLLSLLIVLSVIWIGFTHLQSRFFILAIPVAALAIASLDRWPRWIVASALALSAIVGIARWEVIYDRDTGDSPLVMAMLRDVPALGLEELDKISGIDLASVPDSSVVAFVGDARPFMFARPMSKLRYRTVFDIDAKPGEDALAAWLPKDLPRDATIVVSPDELKRFADPKTGYYAIPSAPADILSRTEPFILRP